MNGDFSVGVYKARVSAMVASVAASVDNFVGIVVLWGRQATTIAILSFFVYVIYTI